MGIKKKSVWVGESGKKVKKQTGELGIFFASGFSVGPCHVGSILQNLLRVFFKHWDLAT